MTKRTRIDFLKEQFISAYNYGIKHEIYVKLNGVFQDPYFCEYKNVDVYSLFESVHIDSESLFNFFIESDPTKNKEYVSWLISLYKNILKKYVQYKSEKQDTTINPAISEALQEWKTFFEDVHSKVNYSLIKFTQFKQSNILDVVNRDIRSFRDYNSFVSFIHSFKATDENSEDILTLRELNCLRNYKNNILDSGKAELVFENNDYLIIITHDKQSNIIFGEKSTWCTSWTSANNYFDRYHKLGELFVLIRKQKLLNKQDRLQFHFEESMYMDLDDRPINIATFFEKNLEIKLFFKQYIVNKVLPKRKNKDINSTINYLKTFGFEGEIFDILIESKTEVLDLTGWDIKSDNLERICEMAYLKEINLTNCKLDHLPEAIGELKELRKFKCRNNPKLKTLPESFNKLEKLEIIDLFNCDIRNFPAIDTNCEIKELILDGNVNLKTLPKNLNKLPELKRLTASGCNIKRINDDILGCLKLIILDLHDNPELSYIPINITKLPNLFALCIDNTKITSEDIDAMKQDKNGLITIIKYG